MGIKTKIRKVWILNALLDCKEWTQKDFRNLFQLMALVNYFLLIRYAKVGIYYTEKSQSNGRRKGFEKYKDYLKTHRNDITQEMKTQINETMNKYVINETLNELKRNKPEKSYKTGVNDALEYKNKSGLVDKGIVKKDYGLKKVTRKHSSKLGLKYSLVEDYKTLYYILREYNNHQLTSSLQKYMLENLMQSEYGNRLINEKLINKIESELRLSLNNDEEKLLLFLLKNSPTVLYKILKKIYDDPSWKEIKETNLWILEDPVQKRDSFFMDIKFWFYEDLQKGFKISQSEVDFNVSISIKTEKDILIHDNPYKIINPEEEALNEVLGESQLEGVITAISGEKLTLNADNEIELKNNERLEVPDYLSNPEKLNELKEKWKLIGYNSLQRRKVLIEDIKKVIDPEKNIFIKNSGEKINEKLWLYPPSNEDAPY